MMKTVLAASMSAATALACAGQAHAQQQPVKNIARPVRVYRVGAEDDANKSSSGPASAALPLPDKPSIAVLPFASMSGDAEQEYFSEGITEDIITNLSHYRSFL